MLHKESKAGDILLILEKFDLNKLNPNGFYTNCIEDKDFLLAALAEGRLLKAAYETVDEELKEKFSLFYQENFGSIQNLFNAILSTENPHLIASFLKQYYGELQENIDQVDIATYQKILMLAATEHEVAEALFINDEKHDSIFNLLRRSQSFSTETLDSKEETEQYSNPYDVLKPLLINVCKQHKDLTFNLFNECQYEDNKIGPFDQKSIEELIITPIETDADTKNDPDELYTLAIYNKVLYRGLFKYIMLHEKTIDKTEIQPLLDTMSNGFQNFLNYLVAAEKAGSKQARKELNNDAEAIRAFAQFYLESITKRESHNPKETISFSEFNLVYNFLMRIRENMSYSATTTRGFFKVPGGSDNSKYIQGLQLLSQLMLEHLPKLPSGNTLTKADILRAALPFLDEARKLGDKDSSLLFDKLAAELHAIEQPLKNLPLMSHEISDQEKKANEKNYITNGSTNKAYGLSLAMNLEREESEKSKAFTPK